MLFPSNQLFSILIYFITETVIHFYFTVFTVTVDKFLAGPFFQKILKKILMTSNF